MFCLDTTRLKNTQNNPPTSSFNCFKYIISRAFTNAINKKLKHIANEKKTAH